MAASAVTQRTETPKKILIVGAGLSGAVLARELAEAGYAIHLVDQRSHLAGNCFSDRDPETGVLVHRYGPHVFHTDDQEVWEYIQRFERFLPYVNRIKATSGGRVYPLPVNLLTINSLFQKALDPAGARAFLEELGDSSIRDPQSFEEQALRFLGEKIYRTFFYGYTKKQWGMEPAELPASILKRLPVRFHYDDNYFDHRFQGMPEGGYTPLVERLLDHPSIQIELSTRFDPRWNSEFLHVFFSGPLDEYFAWEEGRLDYRTLRFEEFRAEGDFQGCAVMNYCDQDVPFTRITEHKHFAPWESHDRTVCFREYSAACGPQDIPYYPIRRVAEKETLARYQERAAREAGVTFVGRLGTYRYLDMDVTVREALDAARAFLREQRDRP